MPSGLLGNPGGSRGQGLSNWWPSTHGGPHDIQEQGSCVVFLRRGEALLSVPGGDRQALAPGAPSSQAQAGWAE